MHPFPFEQVINGHTIKFYQTPEFFVYPIREVSLPDGDTWLVSLDDLQGSMPEDIDEHIVFYFSMGELTACTDEELLNDIPEACTPTPSATNSS